AVAPAGDRCLRGVCFPAHRTAVGGEAPPPGVARAVLWVARGPLGWPLALKGAGSRGLGVGHPKHLRVGNPAVCGWAKTAILDATQKRQRRSPRALQIQIYFIAWVACAREMMARNVFGCG